MQPVQPIGEPLVLRGPSGFIRRVTISLVDGYTTSAFVREALPLQGKAELAFDGFAVPLKGVEVGVGVKVGWPLLQVAVVEVKLPANPRLP